MRLSQVGIGARVGAASAIMVMLLFFVATLAIVRINQAAALSRQVQSHLLPERAAQAEVALLMQRYRTLEYAHLGALVPEDQAAIESAMTKTVDMIATQLKIIATNREALLEPHIELERPWKDYVGEFDQTIRADSRNGMANIAIRRMAGEHEAKFDALSAELALNSKRLSDAVDRGNATLEADRGSTISAVVGATTLAVALGILVSWGTARSIGRALREVVRFANATAQGNLQARLDADAPGEIGQLVAALRAMRDHLAALVSSVQDNVAQVESASLEIAASASDLSRRSEMQARQVKVAVGTVDGMREAVAHTAEAAERGREMATNGVNEAEESRQIMTQVVGRMAAIDETTTNIERMTSTVDSIAYQTNILALNAAVEAANAGSHGKGFAVVASEVRGLAQRSAEAARSISSHSEIARNEMLAGEESTARANASVERILGRVRQIAGDLDRISDSAADQSRQADGIAQSMNAIDEMTQQNAALAQQSAAAATRLLDRAASLKRAAAQFRLTTQP